MDLALGLIETKGLIGAIEAADAMVKAADVEIISLEKVTGALMVIKVKGETAAVKAAVDAGSAASQRVGQLISAHVIPRPDDQIDSLLFDKELLRKKDELNLFDKKKLKTSDFDKETNAAKSKAAESKILKTENKIENETTISSNIYEQKVKKNITSVSTQLDKKEKVNLEQNTQPKSKAKIPSMKELEVLNVHSLRRIAREIDIFPIKGREISKANRAQLLDFFLKIQ